MNRFLTLGRLAAVTFILSAAASATPAAVDSTDEGPTRPERAGAIEAYAAKMRASLDRVVPEGARTSDRGDLFIDLGRGPVPVYVPIGYDPAEPTPVVFLLHGYTSSGDEMEAWWQLKPLADEFGFLYVRPDGESDFLGNPFWNATDACCDLFGGNPDDSGYLLAVLNEVKAQWNVDSRRVYFTGHSNGGFMSHRMACDYPDQIAAIASLAGATWLDPADCAPAGPVHVLQIHGTSDGVIQYDGGCIPFGGCHPGAVETVEQWAAHDGCGLVPDTNLPTLDLTTDIAGAEATVARYDEACEPAGSSELWTIPGGVHSPELSADYSRLVIEHLFAHPKPSPCPADLTGDAAVNSDDLFALLGSWGPCPAPCPTDLTGDGNVNSDDLFALLGAWGPCSTP